MKNSLITVLRDKKTSMKDFRETADKIAEILAVEAMARVKEKKIAVQTPFQRADGYEPAQNVVLAPILRSGMAFLPVFLRYFNRAKVGFLGFKRDEKTAQAHQYYINLPKISEKDLVIILDPMIATGHTAVAALEILKSKKIKETNMLFVSLISAPEGLALLRKNFPKLRVLTGVIDKGLNKNKFILPGIGDFGDRYYGTL